MRNRGDKTREDTGRNEGVGPRKAVISKLRGQTKVRTREHILLVLDFHPLFWNWGHETVAMAMRI